MSQLGEARAERWRVGAGVRTVEQAGEFLADVGLAVLFPAERAVVPSLWEAVADDETEPFATGMNDNEQRVWTWKDELPERGLAWAGKLAYGRASFLSLDLLTALYPGVGELDDAAGFDLSPEARRIAEALLTGPLPSAELRALIGNKYRYDRGLTELQRLLLVSARGVSTQRAGWPAVVVDLTCRLFDVGGRADDQRAASRLLDTVLEATPAEVGRAFGWPVPRARQALDALVGTGAASRDGRVYAPS